jgi:hypothetical protein
VKIQRRGGKCEISINSDLIICDADLIKGCLKAIQRGYYRHGHKKGSSVFKFSRTAYAMLLIQEMAEKEAAEIIAEIAAAKQAEETI